MEIPLLDRAPGGPHPSLRSAPPASDVPASRAALLAHVETPTPEPMLECLDEPVRA